MAKPLVEQRGRSTKSSVQQPYTGFAIAFLLAVGVFFFVFALIVWNHGTYRSMSVVTTDLTTTTTSSPIGTIGSTMPSTTTTTANATGSTGSTSTSSVVPTTSTPTTLQVETSPQSTTTTSDTLIIALVTLGALFLLAAILFTRLTAITLPGGAGLQFTAEGQAEAAGSVAAKVADLPVSKRRKRQIAKQAIQLTNAEIETLDSATSIGHADLERITTKAVAGAQAMLPEESDTVQPDRRD